jgi:hypothetical protein
MKVKLSLYRPRVDPRAAGSWSFHDFQTFGTWKWQGCQPYAPAAFTPKGRSPVLISITGWVNSWAIVRPEGLSQRKISEPTDNQAHDLPTCSAEPQITALPRTPHDYKCKWYYSLYGDQTLTKPVLSQTKETGQCLWRTHRSTSRPRGLRTSYSQATRTAI